MISYEKLSGVKVPAASTQRLIITPEGVAMGHVPGWKALIDPAYPVGNGTRNRALPGNIVSGARALEYSAIGGLPAFSVPSIGRNLSPVARFDINPVEWTWFGVLKNEVVGPTGAAYLIAPIPDVTSGVPLYVVLRPSGQLDVSTEQPTGSTEYRITALEVAAPGSATVLCMITFSTERGLKVYKNGVVVAENPSDTRPLTSGYTKEQFLVMATGIPGSSGGLLAGLQGILDIDLGSPENDGYRRIIESFLLSKYSITAA